jgi:hypothetical protein
MFRENLRALILASVGIALHGLVPSRASRGQARENRATRGRELGAGAAPCGARGATEV